MLVTSITFEFSALYLFGPTKKVLSALIFVCFIREASMVWIFCFL